MVKNVQGRLSGCGDVDRKGKGKSAYLANRYDLCPKVFSPSLLGCLLLLRSDAVPIGKTEEILLAVLQSLPRSSRGGYRSASS